MSAKRRGFTIGRRSFAKISAVEGIRLGDAIDADFREFDRRGLSAEERRNAISEKYGRASDTVGYVLP